MLGVQKSQSISKSIESKIYSLRSSVLEQRGHLKTENMVNLFYEYSVPKGSQASVFLPLTLFT